MSVSFSEYIRFEIDHGVWALGELIEHCRYLPPDAIERDLGIGPGGLRVNLAHTIEAMFFFADCFAGREYVEPADFAEKSGDLNGLEVLLQRAHRALLDGMLGGLRKGLPKSIQWRGTDAGSMSAAAAIAQVFDHATLHRTQCINMLKRLGVAPLPDLDPMSFHLAPAVNGVLPTPNESPRLGREEA